MQFVKHCLVKFHKGLYFQRVMWAQGDKFRFFQLTAGISVVEPHCSVPSETENTQKAQRWVTWAGCVPDVPRPILTTPVRLGLQQVFNTHSLSLSPPIPHAARTTFPWVGSVWSHWALAYKFLGEHSVSRYPLLPEAEEARRALWVASPKFHSHDM